ncbi:MAG: hypothetical protein QOG15_3617 [Solirubrobacteraceae bacterium]|nr:hypothetical protein [Solirubrobacteraceae bacterium]
MLSTAVIAAAGLAISAAPAAAGPLSDAAAPCSEQSLAQPFLPWADPASYTLAPGGTIEGDATAMWSMSGGAAAAAGNEPFFVSDGADTTSLSLPAGSSSTTGAMCVGVEHPTLRFIAKRTGGSTPGSLRVDVLYEDLAGNTDSIAVGSVSGMMSGWRASAPMLILANLLAPLQGGQAAIALRFTPQGNSSWAIDDVYVDPFRRH